jgi:hypothetical protein
MALGPIFRPAAAGLLTYGSHWACSRPEVRSDSPGVERPGGLRTWRKRSGVPSGQNFGQLYLLSSLLLLYFWFFLLLKTDQRILILWELLQLLQIHRRLPELHRSLFDGKISSL